VDFYFGQFQLFFLRHDSFHCVAAESKPKRIRWQMVVALVGPEHENYWSEWWWQKVWKAGGGDHDQCLFSICSESTTTVSLPGQISTWPFSWEARRLKSVYRLQFEWSCTKASPVKAKSASRSVMGQSLLCLLNIS